jgi:hypothetical protein
MAKSKRGSSGSRARRMKPPFRSPELTARSSYPAVPEGTWPVGRWPPPYGTFPPFGTWPVGGTWPIGLQGFPPRPAKKKGATPVWSVRPNWPSTVARSPQQWEYSLIEAQGSRNLGDALGVMGRNGWEAVGFVTEKANQYLILLKRPANVQLPKGKP